MYFGTQGEMVTTVDESLQYLGMLEFGILLEKQSTKLIVGAT